MPKAYQTVLIGCCTAYLEKLSKTPISELLEALKSLKGLQDIVGKHDEALNRIADRLESIDKRLAALEEDKKG